MPRFFKHVVPNEVASKSAGRPIFDDVECVELRFPGNKQTVAVYPAHEAEPNATRQAGEPGTDWAHLTPGEAVTYAMVYKKQYLAFKAGDVQEMSGTPLAELPFLTEGKRRELKALNVFTAEQLSSLDGTPLKQLGQGGREMKNQATAYLQAAAGTADVTEQASRIAALEQQLRDRDELLRQMSAGRTDPVSDASDNAGEDDAGEVEEENADASRFQALSSEELKAFIKDATGEGVRGNPNKATLVRMAEEADRRQSAA